jgi:D-alanine--poly(phosphoribitol) ligase subunit 1
LIKVVEYAATDPDHLAVRDLERELSYAQLRDEVARVGAGLSARGVSEGDRVALLLPNSVDFVVCAFACLWIGAIFVPLAVVDPEARLTTIVSDCAPTVVVASDLTKDNYEGFTSLAGIDLTPFSSLLSGEQNLPEPVLAANRLAYAIYTSGTTGSPKGVLIGMDAFSAAVRSTSDALGLNQATRTLCVSPFYFDGSFGTLFPTLYSGGSAFIRPRELLLYPRTFFRAITDEKISFAGFSPSYLRLLLSSPQMAQFADSPLAVIALGGEASDLEDLRTMWSVAPKIRIFNRYGPTETTIAVTHVHLNEQNTSDGSVPIGSPHPNVDFFLVDEVGSIIDETDRTGELYIGGVQLMHGYWAAPQLTEAVLRTDVVLGETLYRTGDLVYRRESGDYVYVDRADRVIKRSGVRISLIELSRVMRALPHVTGAACIAFDDRGELGIAAFVSTDQEVSAIELRREAAKQLPENMLPNRIVVVDELPMTKSNKLDETRLLSEAQLATVPKGAGSPTSAPNNRQ